MGTGLLDTDISLFDGTWRVYSMIALMPLDLRKACVWTVGHRWITLANSHLEIGSWHAWKGFLRRSPSAAA